MIETIAPVFRIHEVNSDTEEAVRNHLFDYYYLIDAETLLNVFQRPTGVTRHLDRLPEETCILVVACDEKTERPLACYKREEWDGKTEADWREFLRDGTRVRYLQAKMGRIVDLELVDLAGDEEEEDMRESKKAANTITS